MGGAGGGVDGDVDVFRKGADWGSWFPTLATGKSRKDGARRIVACPARPKVAVVRGLRLLAGDGHGLDGHARRWRGFLRCGGRCGGLG